MSGRTVQSVQPGQVWITKDARDKGREVRVEHVGWNRALVTTVTAAPGRPGGVGRRSWIATRTVGARTTLPGWRLVRDAPSTPEDPEGAEAVELAPDSATAREAGPAAGGAS